MSKLNLFIPDKASSHRQEKVSEEIRHMIADIFIRGDLPTLRDADDMPVSLKTPVTVTRVTVSPDLRHATAYVMPLGGQNIPESLQYLASVSVHVRHILSRKLCLKKVPTIEFVLDQSFDYVDKINAVFRRIQH